jgi:hypothetical protein
MLVLETNRDITGSKIAKGELSKAIGNSKQTLRK